MRTLHLHIPDSVDKNDSELTMMIAAKLYEDVSTDNTNFTEIASGEWIGDSKMKVVTFSPVQARYIKIEALTANINYAAATEFEIGRSGTATGVKNEQGSLLPQKFILEQNYPNPFNPNTVIGYRLNEAGHVSLIVYDTLGRKVTTLVNNFQSQGIYHSTFSTFTRQDGQHSSLSSGVYFYRLTVDNNSITKKMLMLK